MANVYSWVKETGEQNANSDGDINWAEGQAPSTVNNSSRAELASHARFYEAAHGILTTTGAALSYALTTELTNPTTVLRDGLLFSFKAHITCGDDPTFNVDATGPKKLYRADLTQVKTNGILVNQHYEVKYDTTLDSGNGGWVLFGTGLGTNSSETIKEVWTFEKGIAYGGAGEGTLLYTGTESQSKYAAGTTGAVDIFDGTPAARTEPAGEDTTDAITVLTAEKGDKRLLQRIEAEGTIVSAATTDIGAETPYRLNVTGTVAITSFGTVANSRKKLRFSGALTLTYNAVSLILPTAADITTAAGDIAEFVSDGAGNWRCSEYLKADGTSLAVGEKPIGVDQQWQDVTGSRVIGTNYQNDTGQAIQVNIFAVKSGVLSQFFVGTSDPANVEVARMQATSATFIGNMTAIVPSGHFYRYDGPAITAWVELRTTP